MDRDMKDYKSFEGPHNMRVSVAQFDNSIVIGSAGLGVTIDVHLRLEDAEKLAQILVAMLGNADAKKA